MYKIKPEDAKAAHYMYHTQGNKVSAIKHVRQITGAGLKEAKDFVDNDCESTASIQVADRDAIEIVKEMMDLAKRMAELHNELEGL